MSGPVQKQPETYHPGQTTGAQSEFRLHIIFIKNKKYFVTISKLSKKEVPETFFVKTRYFY